MPLDATQYPYSPVVFITDVIGANGYRASGILVAPDEVLTASHVLFQQDVGTATRIVVTPGYNGSAPFGTATAANVHYFAVDDAGGAITNAASQNDYALIHLDHPFTNTGTMGVLPDFAGGIVNVTGYPASAGSTLVSSVQAVSRDPYYSLLDGTPLGPGSSGGPVWASNAAGQPYVVGLVSSESFDGSTGYDTLITTNALRTIDAWIGGDHGAPASGAGVVSGTGADVSNELPQLETEARAGALVSVTLIGAPTLPLSLGSLLDNTDALRFITQAFSVDMSSAGARGNISALQARDLGAGTAMEHVQLADGQVVFDPNAPAAAVLRLYQAALGRLPDQVGLHNWVDAIKTGASLSSVADGFISSSEFVGRFGANPSDGAFVDELYADVLHRAPDAAGHAQWTGALAGGVTRGAALVDFAESAESRLAAAPAVQAGIWDLDPGAPEVARLYDTVLGRLPDATGLRTWENALDAGALTPDQVAAQFMQSPEFLGRYGALSNAAFVGALYGNTLHRAPDASGAALWDSALDSGTLSRSGAVLGFSDSAEHQNATAANIYGSDPASLGVKLA